MESFRWNEANYWGATKHGCTPEEIEYAVLHAERGFPRRIDNGKWLLQGRGSGGRMLEIIFLRSPAPVIYVIHAIPVTLRRRR